MRKIYAIVVSLCLILVFTACASDNGTQLYYDYDLSEYITVGDYSVVVDRNSDNYKKLYRELFLQCLELQYKVYYCFLKKHFHQFLLQYTHQ